VKVSCILHFEQNVDKKINQMFGQFFDQVFWHPKKTVVQVPGGRIIQFCRFTGANKYSFTVLALCMYIHIYIYIMHLLFLFFFFAGLPHPALMRVAGLRGLDCAFVNRFEGPGGLEKMPETCSFHSVMIVCLNSSS